MSSSVICAISCIHQSGHFSRLTQGMALEVSQKRRLNNCDLCSQDTVAEMAKNMKSNRTGETQASASELYDFMKRVWPCPWPTGMHGYMSRDAAVCSLGDTISDNNHTCSLTAVPLFNPKLLGESLHGWSAGEGR